MFAASQVSVFRIKDRVANCEIHTLWNTYTLSGIVFERPMFVVFAVVVVRVVSRACLYRFCAVRAACVVVRVAYVVVRVEFVVVRATFMTALCFSVKFTQWMLLNDTNHLRERRPLPDGSWYQYDCG